ncbi:MAG: trypsin-like peptidase domain-containing protein [Oscillospiraceae bacterium]|nr:trypsin-like peptidase domain-containing protein [Oscillospiraceae bacterium]
MDNFENNNLHQESNNTEQEFSPKNELPPVTEAELAQSEQAEQSHYEQAQVEQAQSCQTNGSLPYEPQDMQADGAVQQTESPQQTDGTLPQYAPQQMPYTPQGQYIPQQEPPKKRRFSTGCLCVVIAAVILMFMFIVVISAAISVRDGSKKNEQDSGFAPAIIREIPSESSAEHVTVNIPTVRKPVLEEEMYRDKETGLLTSVGVAKTILPSQVKINAFGEVPYLPASSGSGIILTSDGYILTNAHVIDEANRLAVELYDGTEEKASVVGMDKKSDLAVIKIDRDDLTPAEIGTSADLVIGEEVALAGAGGGFANTVTYGYVTGLDREIDTDYISSSTIRCIQTDVALNPGNSGGALVNMYGQVVGVAVALMNHEKYENIGFSIAIDDAVPIAEELMAKGYVSTRARVGVTFVSLGDDFAKTYNVEAGLCVMDIDPTCDVANAGLEPYDIITHIDGLRVYGTEEILEVLAGKIPGDEITLTIFRKEITGDPITFDVPIKLAPDTSSLSGYSVSKSTDDDTSYDIIK